MKKKIAKKVVKVAPVKKRVVVVRKTIGLVEGLHEVIRWHSKMSAAGAKGLPPELANRLVAMLPVDDDPVFDLSEEAEREEKAIRAFNDDLGAVAKQWRNSIKDLSRDGLENLAIDRAIWNRDMGHVSLGWLRVRLLYSFQEERRHSFGLDTPGIVDARIKFLDEKKELPGSFIDPVTGESAGEHMTEASKLGAPERRRKKNRLSGEKGERTGTIRSFLSGLFKANLEAKKSDKELAKELTAAFPKKTWTEKDIRRKRARYNRKEAKTGEKVPEFAKGKPVASQRGFQKAAKKEKKGLPPVVTKKKVKIVVRKKVGKK